MIFRNNKGISIVEILVGMAIIMIIMPLITSILISSLQDYISGTKFIEQQGQINNVYNVLRRDVEMSSEVVIAQSGPFLGIHPFLRNSIQLKYENPNIATDKFDKTYSFNPSTGDLEMLDGFSSNLSSVFTGADISPILPGSNDRPKSAIFYQPSEKKLWIKIFPKDVNVSFFKGRNFGSPITIYFDVFNKQVTLI